MHKLMSLFMLEFWSVKTFLPSFLKLIDPLTSVLTILKHASDFLIVHAEREELKSLKIQPKLNVLKQSK